MGEAIPLILAGGVAGAGASAALRSRAKSPKVVKAKKPIEQIEQAADVTAEQIRKRFAKRRRATQLSQLSEANIKRQKLGPG